MNNNLIRKIPIMRKDSSTGNVQNWNKGKYKLLPQVGLIHKRYREEIPKEDILDEKLGYLFVKDYEQKDIDALGVVQNQDTKGYGILTGVLSIKFKNFKDRDEVLTALPAKVETEYDHLSLVMARFDNYPELKKYHQKLERDSRVARVKIEILEYQKQGK